MERPSCSLYKGSATVCSSLPVASCSRRIDAMVCARSSAVRGLLRMIGGFAFRSISHLESAATSLA